jgi:glycosyltransferase involved in cell wall biosynthesis
MIAGSSDPAPKGTQRLLAVVHGPVFGGGLNQFVQLREPFLRRGWETIVAVPTEGDAAERLREQGVETVAMPLHRLRATPDPRTQARFLAGIRPEIRALRQLIRERDIDLVQAHGDTNPHAAIAGQLEDVAVVWQLYDTRTPPLLRRVTMPFVTRIADSITTWGQELARVHPGTERLGDRQVVVFPPVDADRFRRDGHARRAAREEFGVPSDAFVAGAVGNRNPSKGYEWLVRALALARREDRSVQARVVGAPSPVHAAYERSVLREAVALGVDDVFDLRDAGTRVPSLMPAFDALVLSSVSRSEGIPTVILEAMACGIPVIATDVGAVREVLVSGEAGLLVPPKDADAIAGAILRLTREPDLAARMGARGRELVEERYRLDRCADRHLRAYELALAHRRARRRTKGAR